MIFTALKKELLMERKYIVLLWMTGAFFPSIVSILLWGARRVVGPFTVSAKWINVELFIGMILCVFALMIYKSGWKFKLAGAFVSVFLLILGELFLGFLALNAHGFSGTQSHAANEFRSVKVAEYSAN